MGWRSPWILVVAIFAGCSKEVPSQLSSARVRCGGKRVLVVSAIADELEPLRSRTVIETSVVIDGETFACGELEGTPVALGLTGIGPQSAEQTTVQALARFDLSTVMFVGIAGGVAQDVRVGDVAVPSRWSHHDREAAQWFDAAPSLLDRVRAHPAFPLAHCDDASVCAVEPVVLVGGSGVTGRDFIASPARAQYLADELGASVTDMETASVAEIAHRHALPFIAVRGISDWVPSGRSPYDVHDFGQLAIENAATVALGLLGGTPGTSAEREAK